MKYTTEERNELLKIINIWGYQLPQANKHTNTYSVCCSWNPTEFAWHFMLFGRLFDYNKPFSHFIPPLVKQKVSLDKSRQMWSIQIDIDVIHPSRAHHSLLNFRHTQLSPRVQEITTEYASKRKNSLQKYEMPIRNVKCKMQITRPRERVRNKQLTTFYCCRSDTTAMAIACNPGIHTSRPTALHFNSECFQMWNSIKPERASGVTTTRQSNVWDMPWKSWIPLSSR